MSVSEALLLALALAGVMTLLGGAGWLFIQSRPNDEARYVTIAWLEAALTKQQERHDAAMAAMDRRLEASVARQDVLERELDAEREKRRDDHARLAEMQRLIEAWMRYARQLADIIRRELKTEPPPEPAGAVSSPPPRPGGNEGTEGLARRIAKRFSLEEINGLAFELGLDGQLAGETAEGRASSLVTVALRREMVWQLVELCRQERPNGGFEQPRLSGKE